MADESKAVGVKEVAAFEKSKAQSKKEESSATGFNEGLEAAALFIENDATNRSPNAPTMKHYYATEIRALKR